MHSVAVRRILPIAACALTIMLPVRATAQRTDVNFADSIKYRYAASLRDSRR